MYLTGKNKRNSRRIIWNPTLDTIVTFKRNDEKENALAMVDANFGDKRFWGVYSASIVPPLSSES